MATDGNWSRSWLNGYEITSNSTGSQFKYMQKANPTMAENVGVHTVSPGILNPTLTLKGYRLHTAGSTHRLLTTSTDTEWVYCETRGENAAPAVGDIGICYVGTRQQYNNDEKLDSPMVYSVPLVSRGVRVPPIMVWMYNSTTAKTTTNVDGSEYDAGAASVGLAAGGIAFLQVYGVTGSDTYNITVKSATSSGGSFSTLATFTGVGAALGGFYAVVSVGTTINRYRKVNIALASGAGDTQVMSASVWFNNFYNL